MTAPISIGCYGIYTGVYILSIEASFSLAGSSQAKILHCRSYCVGTGSTVFGIRDTNQCSCGEPSDLEGQMIGANCVDGVGGNHLMNAYLTSLYYT